MSWRGDEGKLTGLWLKDIRTIVNCNWGMALNGIILGGSLKRGRLKSVLHHVNES